MLLIELLDTKLPIEFDDFDITNDSFKTTTTINNVHYGFECYYKKLSLISSDLFYGVKKPSSLVNLESKIDYIWELVFFNFDEYGALNFSMTKRNDSLKVLSFVKQSALMFTKKYHPNYITFTSDNISRENVYLKIISKSFKIKNKYKFKNENNVDLIVLEI